MSDTGKRPSAARIISAILITLYTGACIYMYYRFMGWTEGSVYESDLPAHIKLAVDDGLIYSLISFILIALDKIHLMQDPDLQKILYLIYIDDLTLKECAVEMCWSYGYTRNRHSDALKQYDKM